MGDDTHPEHWHVAAITAYAATHPLATRDWLDQYANCMSKYPDIYAEALLLVVNGEIEPVCDEGYRLIAERFSALGEWALRRVKRRELERLFNRGESVSPMVVRDYALTGDKQIMNFILEHFWTYREALEVIIELGNKSQVRRASKAVDALLSK